MAEYGDNVLNTVPEMEQPIYHGIGEPKGK